MEVSTVVVEFCVEFPQYIDRMYSHEIYFYVNMVMNNDDKKYSGVGKLWQNYDDVFVNAMETWTNYDDVFVNAME